MQHIAAYNPCQKGVLMAKRSTEKRFKRVTVNLSRRLFGVLQNIAWNDDESMSSVIQKLLTKVTKKV